MTENPIFCSFDVPPVQVLPLAADLKGTIGGVKVGHQFLFAHGHEGLKKIHALGFKTFLDIKFKDIPDRIATEIKALVPFETYFITMHADGGAEMMKKSVAAAKETAAKLNIQPPKLLAITVLTSMDESDLEQIGVNRDLTEQVKCLALLAKDCGMDGVVASAQEAPMLRKLLGPDFLIVTPGIRPADGEAGDQKRVVTPEEAVKLGVDYMVIGRPIIAANNPREAAMKISASIGF